MLLPVTLEPYHLGSAPAHKIAHKSSSVDTLCARQPKLRSLVRRLRDIPPILCFPQRIALSECQTLHSLNWSPFVDLAEMAGILCEPHATGHRTLTGLLAGSIAGRVNLDITQLPSGQRYYLTTNDIREVL